MNNLSPVQQVLLTSMEGNIERLDHVLRGLSYDEYDLSADKEAYPGTWTIREIVHHLADDGDLWSMRLKRAIAEPGVTVSNDGYPGNEIWAGCLDFENRDCKPALALIRAHAAYIQELLSRFYTAWDSELLLEDEGFGGTRSMSVMQIVEMLVNHQEEHLEQIEAVRAFNGV